MNNVQAIIFDVDGTLYPQRSLRTRILIEWAAQFTKEPVGQLRTLKVLRAYRRAHELVRTARSDVSAKQLQLCVAAELSGEHPEFVELSVKEWFQHRPLRHLKTALYPGLLGLLRQAKAHGVRLGILSDYPAAEKLSAMGILEYFDAVVSSHDEGVGHLKPHPLGLRTCLQQLSVEPRRAIYVGDRADVDLPCAASANTQFVLFGKSPNRARCLTVSNYRELSQALGFQS
ncbi:MAG TPA: HAD family hydrolase [Candidatus Acidoferrales bacterium]|nr:HAD family hydrolase [Candidatus Acidoferrales bacterium]